MHIDDVIRHLKGQVALADANGQTADAMAYRDQLVMHVTIKRQQEQQMAAGKAYTASWPLAEEVKDVTEQP